MGPHSENDSRYHLLPETPLGQTAAGYEGSCPHSGARLVLPRTELAERLLWETVGEFELAEGKMFGLLVVRDAQGRLGYGKAFSGLLDGKAVLPGWVPPLHPQAMPVVELRRLEAWKVELGTRQAAVEAHAYPRQRRAWTARREALLAAHRAAKLQREQERAAGGRSEEQLQAESRAHSAELRRLRAEEKRELEPLRQQYQAHEEAWRETKQERRQLSRRLQAEMHQQLAVSVASLLGCPLERLFPGGVPTGTGDCCAPKLLGWAARHGYRPLALAEIWWGPSSAAGRRHGEYYLACEPRCQPLLGPLLATATRPPVEVLYRDGSLLVVHKPSGLLSVAGRYPWSQDCLLTQLAPEELWPVHRLDLETSGVMVLARDPQSQARLREQFARCEVEKVYHALLESLPAGPSGRISAPLAAWPEPPASGGGGFVEAPPRYRIDAGGKPAVTDYRLLDAATRRVELRPLTGRSHQLRVHMAQQLDCPIRGDRLYGTGGERLMLHAVSLSFCHPESRERLVFEAPPPF